MPLAASQYNIRVEAPIARMWTRLFAPFAGLNESMFSKSAS